MKKSVILICFIAQLSLIAQSQSRDIDSLINALKSTKEDTVRVRQMSNLSASYRFFNVDSSISIARRAQSLAERISYPKGVAMSTARIGLANFSKGNYDQAIEACLKALSISEELNLGRINLSACVTLGLCYKELKYIDKSKFYFNKALALATEINYPEGTAVAYSNIAVLFSDKNQYDSALYFSQKALTIHEQSDEPIGIATQLLNMGGYYRQLKNYDKALSHVNRALAMSEEIGDKEGLAYGYLELGEIFMNTLQLPKAITWTEKSLDLATELKNIDLQRAAYKHLYQTYTLQHDPGNALKFRNLEIAMQDSLYSIEKEKIINNLQQKYELEKKQNEIDLLNKDNVIKAQTLREQVLRERTLVYGLILLAIFLFLVIRNNNQRRKTNVELAQQNVVILEQKQKINTQNENLGELNKVKDRLFSIIGHDLRGPMHALHSALYLIEDGAINEESFRKYRTSIAGKLHITNELLNNLLSWAQSQMQGGYIRLQQFDLIKLIKENIELAETIGRDKNITFQFDIASVLPVKADRSMIDIVLRNLLSNAIKYSHKDGFISVSAQIKDNIVQVSITDYGVGISEENKNELFKSSFSNTTPGTLKEKGTGLGLMLCKELIEKNQGSIYFESEAGKGSKFMFSLPKIADVVTIKEIST